LRISGRAKSKTNFSLYRTHCIMLSSTELASHTSQISATLLQGLANANEEP